MGRFITKDPIRAGINYYVYANNNPMMYIDPTGLISEKNESALDFLSSTGVPREAVAKIRSNMVKDTADKITGLEQKKKGLVSDYSFNEDYITTQKELSQAKNDLMRNITVEDYDGTSGVVDSILNDRLADEAVKLAGSNYVYGGKPQNNKGGLDCAGVAESAMERASNSLVRSRTANELATDPKLTVPGNGGRGTLNFYAWPKDSNPNFDHVTVNLGNGLMANPQGGPENSSFLFPGNIVIRGPFRTTPVNRQVNWRYLMFE